MILRSEKFTANANIFEKIEDLMNQGAANNHQKYRMSFSQAQNKFKK